MKNIKLYTAILAVLCSNYTINAIYAIDDPCAQEGACEVKQVVKSKSSNTANKDSKKEIKRDYRTKKSNYAKGEDLNWQHPRNDKNSNNKQDNSWIYKYLIKQASIGGYLEYVFNQASSTHYNTGFVNLNKQSNTPAGMIMDVHFLRFQTYDNINYTVGAGFLYGAENKKRGVDTAQDETYSALLTTSSLGYFAELTINKSLGKTIGGSLDILLGGDRLKYGYQEEGLDANSTNPLLFNKRGTNKLLAGTLFGVRKSWVKSSYNWSMFCKFGYLYLGKVKFGESNDIALPSDINQGPVVNIHKLLLIFGVQV